MGGPSSLPAFFWVLNSDPHACRHFVPQVTFPDPLSLKRNPIKSIILPLLLPESLSRDFCLQLPLKDPRPPFQDTLIHGVLVPANLSSIHHPHSPFQPRSPTLPLLATAFRWVTAAASCLAGFSRFALGPRPPPTKR